MPNNRLLFKNGFINYWIWGSVLLVFRRHLHEAILVKYISKKSWKLTRFPL